MKAGRDEALDAQMAECRALLAEVRGATKDLKQVIRQARATYPELSAEAMERAAAAAIAEMTAATEKAIGKAEAAIHARFNRITNLLLTGTKVGVPRRGDINIEKMAEDVAAKFGGIAFPGINLNKYTEEQAEES